MPAKKTAKKTAKKLEVTFSSGRTVQFPPYKPVGRTKAETKDLMKEKGMHSAMIAQATKFMKK